MPISPSMEHMDIINRTGWPDELSFLLNDLPRDTWPDHPGFARATRNWMGAHLGFRHLSGRITDTLEEYLDKRRDPGRVADDLGQLGHVLVRNLHGHHTWEDRSFFPELREAEPRFQAGLDTLEADHEVLDETLGTLTDQANRVIKLIQLDPAQARDEAGPLHETAAKLDGFLARHLQDEEDLIVPIILHHRLRG